MTEQMWRSPRLLAAVSRSDLGDLGPLPEQTRLGDFWIPQRGLFAFGRGFFEPFDETRHVLVSHAPSTAGR